MTQIAIRSEPVPIQIEVGKALRLSDVELFELCVQNPELRIERSSEGNLTVMTPAGGESSHRNLRIATALSLWADQDGTGTAFDSSAGFLLPNGAMRSPAASWVSNTRLAELRPDQKRGFIPLCPDFVIELRSPTDRLPDLQAKMEEYRANGAKLGWLIDPDERRVYVYRSGAEVEVLEKPGKVTSDPEPLGFALNLGAIWRSL